jgi:hypothetical protein
MRTGNAGRWSCMCLLLAVPFAAAASCGGAPNNADVFAGGLDGSLGDGSGGSSGGGSGSGSGGIIAGDDGGDGGQHNGCTPKTCQSAGYDCGMNGDGCGGTLDCGTCTSPAFCGGGGYSKCGGIGLTPDGAPACSPTTCQALGYDCGPAGDGCGGLLQCGTCSGSLICGGSSPGVCGTGVNCTNLCKQQVACDGGTPTTITGRVVAGTIPTYGTPDPVPNVLVYVPNSPPQPFTTGVQCGCPEATGDPLVWTTTAVDGTFTLPNVPVGTDIPVVIQLGRWRREVTFNITTSCMSSAVGDIRMPRTKTDGLGNQADIPLTALSTGSVDAMECVLLKMGVDVSEFTNAGGTGRVQLYYGNGSNAAAAPESQLTTTLATLEQYDQVLFPCWGDPVDKTAAQLANIVSYTSAGGRMFATHFSYTWLYTNSPFDTTATWDPDNEYDSDVGAINTSFPRGATFGQWMTLVGAATGTPPEFPITSPRNDFINPVVPSLTYVNATQNGTFPLHYTFDTPWQATTTCGRVVYSDFHVADLTSSGLTFPAECDTNQTTGVTCTAAAPCPMNPQEKALEYMIWDLGQCVGPTTPQCTPQTCMSQNIGCGPAGDGCGGTLQCGPCTSPQTCGGGGQLGQCGYPDAGPCMPTTCQALGIQCGPAGDGCGGLLQCGNCTSPQTCGGGGTSGMCGGGSAQ